MLNDVYDRMYAAADSNIPKFKSRKYFSKPWWNAECTKVWKKREKMYKNWKNSGRNEDRLSWKRARTIATRTFKQSKRQDM